MRPTASAIEDVSVVLSYFTSLHGLPPRPSNHTLDVHFNDRVARAAIVSATKGLRPAGIGLPATIEPVSYTHLTLPTILRV